MLGTTFEQGNVWYIDAEGGTLASDNTVITYFKNIESLVGGEEIDLFNLVGGFNVVNGIIDGGGGNNALSVISDISDQDDQFENIWKIFFKVPPDFISCSYGD